MPTYKITDPNTGKTLRLTGDSPPSEAELNEIFSSVGDKTEPTPAPEKKGITAGDVVKEPFRLAQEAVTGPISLAKKVGAGIGGLARTGYGLVTGEGLDKSLQAGTDVINKYKAPVQGPMDPSLVARGLSSAVEAQNRKARETGTEWTIPMLEASMDILGVAGMAKVAPKVVSAAKAAPQAALRAIEKIPTMNAESLYAQALQPTKSTQRAVQLAGERAVKTGLEKGVAITGSKDTILPGKSINDLVTETFGDEGLYLQGENIVKSPEFAARRVSLDNIANSAKSAANELAAGNKSAARSAVDKVVTELQEVSSFDKETNTISALDAYRQKQKLYHTLQKAFEQDNVVGLKDAQREVESSIRDITGEIIPELKDVLAKEGENLNFIKYAERRANQLAKQGILSGEGVGLLLNAKKWLAMKVLQIGRASCRERV